MQLIELNEIHLQYQLLDKCQCASSQQKRAVKVSYDSSQDGEDENENEEDESDFEANNDNNDKDKLSWSSWSNWSTCSRTCDGGVMQQIRRCQNLQGCRGENVRYRICNMQTCPEQQDFRARQCSAYDDVPYDGTLYKWTPHYDYSEPCALTCKYVL